MNTTVISLIFSGIMMVIGVTTFIITQVRSAKKDTVDTQQEQASLREGIFKANMKLDQLCATVNDIKTDIKSMDVKLNDHSQAIAVLKRDLETAFMRIDELRDMMKGEKTHVNS